MAENQSDGTSEGAPPVPLPALVEEFLVGLRASKPSVHTVRAYRMDLTLITDRLAAHVGRQVGELTASDLTAANLRAVFADYADSHAKTSVARARSTMSRLCDYLVVEGQITGSPMAAVGKPRITRGAPHAFTEDDMDRLLAVLSEGRIPGRNPWPVRDYALITTLAVTGLRASELLDLTIGDIEGAPGARQVAVRHGKGDKYRAVPIDARLDPLLTSYLAERWQRFGTPTGRHPAPTANPWTAAPPTTPLWVDGTGEPMTVGQLEYLVRKAYTAAGINSHRPAGALIHALRHTFATRLIENGASAVELMTLLGHAGLGSTTVYVSSRPDYLRDAVKSNPTYSKLPGLSEGMVEAAADAPVPGVDPGLR